MRSLRSRTTVLATAGLLSLGLAACGGGGEASDAPDVEPDVEVVGTDSLKYEPTELEAEAGTIAIGLTSGESVEHNVVIRGVDGDSPVVEAPRGQTKVGTVDLEAGEYEFFCSIPGHEAAGMVGNLTVS